MIRIFDLTRPGKQISSRATSKTKRSKIGQRGIISCIAFNPDYSGMYAAGSYANTIGIYSELDGDLLCMLEGHCVCYHYCEIIILWNLSILFNVYLKFTFI